MTDAIRGACHCGAVRFELVLPTLFSSHCHCDSCRRVHSAAFVTWTAVSTNRFRIVEGEDVLVPYRSSEHATRSFCRSCGTHVLYTSTEWPDKAYVPVATLLDAMDREPDCHLNTSEAVSWCVLGDDLPKHGGFGGE